MTSNRKRFFQKAFLNAVSGLTICVFSASFASAQDGGIQLNVRQPQPDIEFETVGGDTACTISVPVKINRLHKDVQAVLVVCGLWDNEADAKSFKDSSMRGVGFTPIQVGNSRAYNRKVSVPIKKKPATIASGRGAGAAQLATQNPTHWGCGLSFQVKGAGSPEKPSPIASKIPLKATGTFRGLVWGKLKS